MLIDDAQPHVLDERLAEDIRLIEDPANQGTPLAARDYVLLLIVTVAVPIALAIWGGLLA